MKLRSFREFKNDQNGAIALIIAITLVAILFGVMALSIDMNRTQTSYVNMQGSTDAAALSTAEWILKGKIEKYATTKGGWNPLQTQMEEYAEKILLQNFAKDNSTARYDSASLELVYTVLPKPSSPNESNEYKVQVSACANLTDKLADAAGHTDPNNDDDTRVCTTSTAAFDLGKLKDTEVAFALDFTNSMFWHGDYQYCPPGTNDFVNCPRMNNTKAYNLYTTMNNILEIYYPTNPDSTAYLSIVPYAGIVNIYPYSDTMIDGDINQPVWPSGKYMYLARPDVEEHNLIIDELGGSAYNHYTKLGDYPIYYTQSSYSAAVKTKDLTYILDRIPVIESEGVFNDIVSNGSTANSILPLRNYKWLVDYLKTHDFIISNSRATETLKRYATNYPEGYASAQDVVRRMYAYNGGIIAGADQRIERDINNDDGSVINGVSLSKGGVIRMSDFMKGLTKDGEKDLALHESYPVQPLTNRVPIAIKLLERFVSNKYLYEDSETLPQSRVLNGQQRLNKARYFGSVVDTQSLQGLIWAWFTVNPTWQNKWDEESVTEEYYDDVSATGIGAQSQSNRENNDLPSDNFIKHIIVIADGNDNDGEEELVGGTGNDIDPEDLFDGMGWVRAFDGYAPVEKFSDQNYDRLCRRIAKDDIKVSFILYDFIPETVENKYKKCAEATGGFYFVDVKPNPSLSNSLKEVLDTIFQSVLTDLTPVRLVQ